MHERDIFLGNSGHFLGYGKLGYQKAIRPKWASKTQFSPTLKCSNYSIMREREQLYSGAIMREGERTTSQCSNYEREGARVIAMGWDAPTLNCSNYSILKCSNYWIFDQERERENYCCGWHATSLKCSSLQCSNYSILTVRGNYCCELACNNFKVSSYWILTNYVNGVISSSKVPNPSWLLQQIFIPY